MNIRLSLETLSSRVMAFTVLSVTCVCLLYLVMSDYLVGALTDERIAVTPDASAASFMTAPFTDDRIGVNPDTLATAARYLPNSPSLHLRLAEFEIPYAEDNLKSAQFHALRAIELSPNDYRPLVALASIQASQENLPAAEKSLRAALRLAPGNLEAHWQLGAVHLQRGQLSDSLGEFRAAASGNAAYLRAALDQVWEASGGKPDAVEAVTPDSAKDRLTLAAFLLQKSRVTESATIFRKIERNDILSDRDSSTYLNNLIKGGHVTLAHDLWLRLVKTTERSSGKDVNLVWNGGFESDILVDFAQFDWSIRASNYAQISIDRGALRIDFLGRETTRLEGEITQVILVRPGARYRLSYAVKTQGLIAPEGPRVAVSTARSTTSSDPVTSGTRNWRRQTLEFAASAPTIALKIQQLPKYSYEDPTQGTVWFDDFQLQEISS